jgi:transposase
MDVVHVRCCGIDVHKRTVVACLLASNSGGALSKQVRTFGTMTQDLLCLADWLTTAGCTHVAMESTGVYWKPVYNLLPWRSWSSMPATSRRCQGARRT